MSTCYNLVEEQKWRTVLGRNSRSTVQFFSSGLFLMDFDMMFIIYTITL